ncbi:MAG: DeoR/GlpR family DNA-binding transcription regulator [Alicyclobacillus sp.]|nr:DeoR/GlpR family DNA-binding transcription regulator [Alicyclobacillus sp.]
MALVTRFGEVEIQELARRFGVSAMTIRRDLKVLTDEGLLERTHGGAMQPDGGLAELTLDDKRESHPHEKEQIADLAMAFVEPGMSLLLDAGTTTFAVAKRLTDVGPLRVITNDLAIAQMLSDVEGLEVYMVGGLVKAGVYSTHGEFALGMLGSIYVDLAFIGCDSFRAEAAMSRTTTKAAIKQGMMRAAGRTVLLADSSKYGHHSFQRIAPLSAFDAVVSDAAFPETEAAALLDAGVRLCLPDPVAGLPRVVEP